MSENLTPNSKNFKHAKPVFFVAKEFLSPDATFMIRITGRTGKYVAYSWELVRPKPAAPGSIARAAGGLASPQGTPSAQDNWTGLPVTTARFFQVYTTTVLGVVRINNPMNRQALADLVAIAEHWILEQTQFAEDARQQARIDRETDKAGRGQQAPRAGLKTARRGQ